MHPPSPMGEGRTFLEASKRKVLLQKELQEKKGCDGGLLECARYARLTLLRKCQCQKNSSPECTREERMKTLFLIINIALETGTDLDVPTVLSSMVDGLQAELLN